jgi:hypothetical protein
MTRRTTLRLGSLAAAIVLTLSLVSSASAKPVGSLRTGPRDGAAQSVKVSAYRLHRSGMWVQHNPSGSSIAVVAPMGPADRTGGRATISAASVAPRPSAGFDWTDAAIGALFGIGLAMIAVFATGAIRGRRGGLVLRT